LKEALRLVGALLLGFLASCVATIALADMTPATKMLLVRGPVVAVGQPVPISDWSFMGPSLPAPFTITRSSTANYFSSAGTLTSAAVDTARFDYNPLSLVARGLLIEESRTNSIRNNTGVGASAGTPGTPPTNWAVINTVGASVTLVGTGTEDNLNYVDYRFFGTASGAGTVGVSFETATGIAAATGQQWAISVWERLTAGTLTNITSHSFGVDENTSGGVFVRANTAVVGNPTASAVRTQRRVNPVTTAGGGTVAAVFPFSVFNVTGAGALDLTVRFAIPQLELGAVTTSPILTSGSTATRAADVVSTAHTIASYPVSYYVEGTEPIIQTPIAGFLTIDDGTAANRLVFRETAGVNLFNAGYYSASVLQAANPTIGSANAGSTWKAAINFSSTTVRGSMSGAAVIGAAGGTAPGAGLMTTMRLGVGQVGGLYANGYVRRVQYWNVGLTDPQLVVASQ
jgi:hypothetical protein